MDHSTETRHTVIFEHDEMCQMAVDHLRDDGILPPNVIYEAELDPDSKDYAVKVVWVTRG